MADKRKRTFNITVKADDVADAMKDDPDIPFDKSSFVDRAIKYYWHQMQQGELDDPMVRSLEAGNVDVDVDSDGEDDDGFFDNVKDRLG